MYRLQGIRPAPAGSPKKYVATFVNRSTGRTKSTSFGARGYSDFTMHHDEQRRQRYEQRHSRRENWRDPTSAGALSRQVLWNKPTLRGSIADQKRRFNL